MQKNKALKEFNSLPSSISYKQLNVLLSAAKKEANHDTSHLLEQSNEEEDLKDLLHNWACLSEDLLRTLKKISSSKLLNKNPKSLMALGALQAHLNMALQAKEASEKNQ